MVGIIIGTAAATITSAVLLPAGIGAGVCIGAYCGGKVLAKRMNKIKNK